MYLDYVDLSDQCRPCTCKHTVSADTYPPQGGAMSLLLGYGGNPSSAHVALMSVPQMTGQGRHIFFIWNVSNVVQKVMPYVATPFQVLWLKRTGFFYFVVFVCLFMLFSLYLLFFPACKNLQCLGWDI